MARDLESGVQESSAKFRVPGGMARAGNKKAAFSGG
jgi:hypothetical protein